MTVITQRQTLLRRESVSCKKDFNKWSDLFFWNKWKLRSKRKREEAEKVQQQQTDSIADDKAKSELKRKRAQE